MRSWSSWSLANSDAMPRKECYGNRLWEYKLVLQHLAYRLRETECCRMKNKTEKSDKSFVGPCFAQGPTVKLEAPADSCSSLQALPVSQKRTCTKELLAQAPCITIIALPQCTAVVLQQFLCTSVVPLLWIERLTLPNGHGVVLSVVFPLLLCSLTTR